MGDPSTTNGTSRSHTSFYSRSPYSSTSGSPPEPVFKADIFNQAPNYMGGSQTYGTSPTAERHSTSNGSHIPSLTNSVSDPVFADPRSAPAIVIRKLSRSIGDETLNSMLTFAGDLIDTEFVRSPYPEDHGYATAIARFRSQAGALEAQQKLHGKPNTTKAASMIVEIHRGGMAGSFERRATIDGTASRGQASSASSGGSMGGPPGRSRYGSAFVSSEKMSPPLLHGHSNQGGEFPIPESSAHFQNLFSPTSPVANEMHDRQRISGKAIINDSNDDETGELLRDPLTFARNGQHAIQRRATQPATPLARFGSLSLNTSHTNGNSIASPPASAMALGRNGAMRSPAPLSPSAASSANSAFNMNYPRHQYPPINPADQNPPCNTLYVGNLPIDTSEDELKAVFSKQRGYKRLCFRTKQNGPMCFVEFEDVSFATKALNELYGHPLHNSVKGGIRLSFSKNPLGVRAGQANSMGASAPMSPHAMAPGYTGGMMSAGNFGAASGPPPGLVGPPGLALANIAYRSSTGLESMFANPFGMPQQDFSQMSSGNAFSGGLPPNLGTGAFGRESRGGYAEYSMGR